MENLKLLVVDDEPNIVNTMQLGLEAKGYTVITALSGEEALEKYQREKPDVILLDLKLSGIDGMEVLRKIKQQDQRTEVIMMTAYGSVKTAVEAMKIGAYDYITKPSSVEEVSLILRNIEERFKLYDENEGRINTYCNLERTSRNSHVSKKDFICNSSTFFINLYAYSGPVRSSLKY